MCSRSLSLLLLCFAVGCLPKAGGGSSSTGGSGGGGGSSSTGGDASQSCTMPGATRACCNGGTQTCVGTEFPTWGACLAADGTTLVCGGGTCASGEFSQCDGGAPPLPPTPKLCTAGGVNNEPEILVGYAPATGQSVGAGGQVKVWVNDEGAPIIAPGEIVDPTSGTITTPGDRTAKAPDGYLWEPALYIAPQAAENGGTSHFPSLIRGDYNNTTQKGAGLHVAGMDPPPAGSVLSENYTAEMIWSVDALALPSGQYIAEFVIHDGDRDRGVGCVTITIQ
jgi:hypothetical protein